MTPRRTRTATLSARDAARVAVVVVVSGALALSGCGTRADDAQVAAGAGAGTVTLSPESVGALTQLRDGVESSGTAPAALASTSQAAADTRGGGTTATAKQATRGGTGAQTTAAGPKPGTTASVAPVAPARPGGCRAALAPVAVGQVGYFSGVLGPITGSMRTTLAAWAKDLNSRGGLGCHPVTVYSSDDGGDPARSAFLVQDLIARHNVVAFVASAIVIPAGFHQAIANAKVPAVGGPGFESWRDSPWVFPESASAADQVFGLIRNGVEQGKRRLGLIHCVEVSACSEAANDFKVAAPAAGAELVYSAPASVTQTDYTAGCLNARKAGVDQLAVALDGASIGRVARSCRAIGYQPLLSSLAALLSPGQAADPLVREFGLATATGNAPWILRDSPGLREYHQVLTRWAPQVSPDAASVTAFTSAKLLEAAIAKVAADIASDRSGGGPITPELVLRGLGGIRDESLGGLTVGLTFRPGQQKAASSGCVFLELLTTAGWTAPKGSSPVCRPR